MNNLLRSSIVAKESSATCFGRCQTHWSRILLAARLSEKTVSAIVMPLKVVVCDIPTATRPAANDSIQLQPPAKSV